METVGSETEAYAIADSMAVRININYVWYSLLLFINHGCILKSSETYLAVPSDYCINFSTYPFQIYV